MSAVPLLVLALPEESRPLLKALGRKSDPLAPAVKRGRVGKEVTLRHARVLTTGMGPRNAREAFAEAVAATRPSWVITGGIAGGLDPALQAGDARFDADVHFPETARLQRLGVSTGRFVLVERVAATAAAKQTLREQTGADLVDMESAAIRELCRSAGIPSATVRTISDTAEENLPLDFSALVDADQQLVWWKLAGAIARSPSSVPRLMRLQQRVSLATGRLAEVLAAMVSNEP